MEHIWILVSVAIFGLTAYRVLEVLERANITKGTLLDLFLESTGSIQRVLFVSMGLIGSLPLIFLYWAQNPSWSNRLWPLRAYAFGFLVGLFLYKWSIRKLATSSSSKT